MQQTQDSAEYIATVWPLGLDVDQRRNEREVTMNVRSVEQRDFETIVEIYNHYVQTTVVTFEEESISVLDIENRIKEGKNTRRWDKTSCHKFAANEARLKMGFLAYNLLHLIRRFYLWGEETRRSIEWIIMRLIKAGARIVYHARYWYVHIASAFPLRHHYRAVLDWQH